MKFIFVWMMWINNMWVPTIEFTSLTACNDAIEDYSYRVKERSGVEFNKDTYPWCFRIRK